MSTATVTYRLILIVALVAFSATAAGRVLPGGPSSLNVQKAGAWNQVRALWTPAPKAAADSEEWETPAQMMQRAWDLDVDF